MAVLPTTSRSRVVLNVATLARDSVTVSSLLHESNATSVNLRSICFQTTGQRRPRGGRPLELAAWDILKLFRSSSGNNKTFHNQSISYTSGRITSCWNSQLPYPLVYFVPWYITCEILAWICTYDATQFLQSSSYDGSFVFEAEIHVLSVFSNGFREGPRKVPRVAASKPASA